MIRLKVNTGLLANKDQDYIFGTEKKRIRLLHLALCIVLVYVLIVMIFVIKYSFERKEGGKKKQAVEVSKIIGITLAILCAMNILAYILLIRVLNRNFDKERMLNERRRMTKIFTVFLIFVVF